MAKDNKVQRSGRNQSKVVRSYQEINHFSGPVPPPQVLEQYEKIVPGIAVKIFESVEKQSSHRQEIEKLVIKHNIVKSYIGQTSAFIIGIAALSYGFVSILQGKSPEGIATIIGTLVTGSGINLYGKYKHDQELKRRREEALH